MSLEKYLISQRVYCSDPQCMDKAKVCRTVNGTEALYCWQHDPETRATQVCSAGEWPETDHGGNWTPDRIEANYAFSEWLDQQGDSIVPGSFSEWLGSEDSIFIE